jgi:PIN domain nuclease of toxin-antitoxin system
MIILDTHAWIWLINGDTKIERSTFFPVIKKKAKQSALYISAISLWELSMLEAKGRIALTENAKDWMKKALSAPGIGVQPITPEIAYDSANLPGKFVGDPADRFIVASARVLNAGLVTFDKEIHRYAHNGYVDIAS